MANSIHQDKQGPVWPLGNILVPTPGTPVSIMNLVDPTFKAAPETPTAAGVPEYTNRAQQISFQGYHSGGASRLTANTGNIYITKLPTTGGGGTTDVGTVLWVVGPGLTWTLGSAALNRNVFNLYEFYIDADTANDGAQVTAIIQ